ncbi:MAG: hypothetical protein ACREO4_03565 [Lysobacter sp.]
MAFGKLAGSYFMAPLAAAALFAAVSGCSHNAGNSEAAAVLEAVASAEGKARPIDGLVLDADVDVEIPGGATRPYPIERGPAELDRNASTLKPSQLGIVRLEIIDDQAQVETRSVSAHTNKPGSTLDCGITQTFHLSKRADDGRWVITEIDQIQC